MDLQKHSNGLRALLTRSPFSLLLFPLSETGASRSHVQGVRVLLAFSRSPFPRRDRFASGLSARVRGCDPRPRKAAPHLHAPRVLLFLIIPTSQNGKPRPRAIKERVQAPQPGSGGANIQMSVYLLLSLYGIVQMRVEPPGRHLPGKQVRF